MDEAKLKKDIKHLRDEIMKRKKRIKEVYLEMKVYRDRADELRKTRDGANDKSKEMREEAKKFISERNGITKEISELKQKRGKFIDKVKDINRAMTSKKTDRNSLNKNAKGKFISLMNGYTDSYEKLSDKDVPLEEETVLFDRIFELQERLVKARTADSIHKEILDEYEKTKKIDNEIDRISVRIREMAAVAQQNHEAAMRIFKDIDELRKSGDDAHKKLLEKYDEMRPFKDRITLFKKEIDALQEELSPLNEQLRDIHSKREDAKKEESLMEAKERIKNRKRLDINDFKLLLEKGELDLKK